MRLVPARNELVWIRLLRHLLSLPSISIHSAEHINGCVEILSIPVGAHAVVPIPVALVGIHLVQQRLGLREIEVLQIDLPVDPSCLRPDGNSRVLTLDVGAEFCEVVVRFDSDKHEHGEYEDAEQ